MKSISFVVPADYLNNRIFDLSNSSLNRDNCLLPFSLLKEEFKKHDYDLQTSDIVKPEQADIVLFNEMPKPFTDCIDKSKSYLLLFETDLIRPDNWDFDKHGHFKKIFTWNDKIVDGQKYLKFNFPNELQTTPPDLMERPGFATLISGNKSSRHPLELYSERRKTISWFEKNYPSQFEYYGIGWDYSFDMWFQKLFRKLKILPFLPKSQSACYKGRVDKKIEVLRKYKFAICYENGRDIDGYITEKIFDCFFAGTIPIYWGPQNIANYIPEECFINRIRFKSHEEMYSFLSDLKQNQIVRYQENILNFLNSNSARPFSNQEFAQNIVKGILNE